MRCLFRAGGAERSSSAASRGPRPLDRLTGQPASGSGTLLRILRPVTKERYVPETTAQHATERADFQATSDPGLLESADRGEAKLLTYRELYLLWERQQWRTQDLDFSRDRVDWHERISPDERYARMYGLSSFFVGEQRVAAELGPMMRAAPDEDMRIFLCTQIADEARHVAFFDRFYSEVGVLEADGLAGRLEETSQHLNPEFEVLFDELLRRRV